MAKKRDGDDEDDEPMRRVDFDVSLRTYRYLSALKRRKTHGNTITAIVRRFVDDGVQDAIDRHYISFEDGDRD